MNEQLKSSVAGPEMGSIQRKPYAAPVLESFGNIRAMTQSLGNTGMSDGGTGTNKKSMV